MSKCRADSMSRSSVSIVGLPTVASAQPPVIPWLTVPLLLLSSALLAPALPCSALDRTLAALRSSTQLARASLSPREITQEIVSLEGCDSFILVADADQSRLLVSNSAHDTALSHTSLEAILATNKKMVLAVVGGRTRGYSSPNTGQLWSDSVERVLRQTQQTLALKVGQNLLMHA